VKSSLLAVCALFLQVIVLPLGASAADADRVDGEPVAPAESEPVESAQQLASRACEFLRQGEDAANEEAKRAAYSRGLALARRAVALDDRNADAHFAVFGNEGRLLLLDGATPNPVTLLKVNKELDRVLALDPNHSDALAAKGGLYRQLPWILGGSLSKAEDYLNRAIELNPTAVSARIELAETYRDMGEPQRGRSLLEAAASIAEQQGKARQLTEARHLLAELGSAR
jgi:tetratricopeptide (TPR) repeat protein